MIFNIWIKFTRIVCLFKLIYIYFVFKFLVCYTSLNHVITKIALTWCKFSLDIYNHQRIMNKLFFLLKILYSILKYEKIFNIKHSS